MKRRTNTRFVQRRNGHIVLVTSKQADPQSHAGTTLIVNVGSRKTADELDNIRKLLAEQHVPVAHFHAARSSAEVRSLTKQAVAGGCALLIAGGGDGTMTTVVAELAGRDVVLGVLPLGTGNSFAQTLKLPLDLRGAVAVIARGHSTQVDLGIVNGTYFANFATIGLASEIAKQTPKTLKRRLGMLAYAVAGLRLAFRHRAFQCELQWDGNHTERQLNGLIVANGRIYGYEPLTPDASIVDAKLSVATSTGLRPFDVALFHLALALGLQRHLPGAHFFSAEKLTVKASPAQSLSIDGEPFGKTPAQFSIAPRALRVMVPGDFDAPAS